ncbi:uncharacterized protein LOC136087058 [Hydra vulgaris]|uniref:Uncharacterized protein LOC136087058 n=1 Tax=Hydra vulgaris TaxID=6087 RepID=A0ABM4CUL5_HYDVU
MTVFEPRNARFRAEKNENESPIKNISKKSRILEDRSRRNNLRIEGITESINETWDEIEDKALKLFSNTLKVNEVEIDRAHRTGYKKEGRPRNIIMKLLRYKDKVKILKEAHCLKGLNIYINEDYSRETTIIRKKLFIEAKQRREKGENVGIRQEKARKINYQVTYLGDKKQVINFTLAIFDETAAAAI